MHLVCKHQHFNTFGGVQVQHVAPRGFRLKDILLPKLIFFLGFSSSFTLTFLAQFVIHEIYLFSRKGWTSGLKPRGGNKDVRDVLKVEYCSNRCVIGDIYISICI